MKQNSTQKTTTDYTNFGATDTTIGASNQTTTFCIEHGHTNSFDDYPKKWDKRGWF